MLMLHVLSLFFFFNDTATTEIYTLSLHDALPIYLDHRRPGEDQHLHPLLPPSPSRTHLLDCDGDQLAVWRSEEHTSELQSRLHLVCRLLLEKKNIIRVRKGEARLNFTLTTHAVML